MTSTESFAVPQVSDILDQLGQSKGQNRARVFSKIDLSSSFHQLALEEQAKPKTAFSTTYGHFQFKRMPFGLKGASHSLSLTMLLAMHDLIGKILLLYMDDLIVYGSTMEEHLARLRIVFQRLRDVNLKVSPEKTELCTSQTLFLGHIISEKGCFPNPEKVAAITKLPQPRTIRGVRSFIGLLNYYRRYYTRIFRQSQTIILSIEKRCKIRLDFRMPTNLRIL